MEMSAYHRKYAELPDEEIQRRADVKERELEGILALSGYRPAHVPVRVAVLGCGDQRFIPHHWRIFEKQLRAKVELTTFDITLGHLAGSTGAIRCDVTKSIQGGPYDITYAHVLLKFIETEKQWDAIMNSYKVLRAPGIAIHVFDEDEVIERGPKLADGLYAVPLDRWDRQLKQAGIPRLRETLEIDGPRGEAMRVPVLALLKEEA